MHPYILSIAEHIDGCRVHTVADNNLILEIPGKENAKTVVLTAHLDKINHFGKDQTEHIPFKRGTSFLEGILDDAVGLGILLRLAQDAAFHDFPPLLLCFSEMEESTGLKQHPHLLKNSGQGYYHGMGAERISQWLLKQSQVLHAVITVDTTPIFRGENGVALYGRHWEFTQQPPSPEEEAATEALCEAILQIDPEIIRSNNTNDYLTYGKLLNADTRHVVPSIALEPAIFPYHQANERVYLSDIERTYHVLKTLLQTL